MKTIRSSFYRFISKISETQLTKNTTGSGIYDRKVILNLKKIKDPYPYFRGLVSELTDNIETIEFHQPSRKFGKTKNNFFSLYDIAINIRVIQNQTAKSLVFEFFPQRNLFLTPGIKPL